MNSTFADQQRRPHRRFQFGLAALLALVLVCGAGGGLRARWLRHQRRVKLATQLAAPVSPLLQYVPYLMAEIDVVSGEYGRRNLALCVLRRTGHIQGDSPHICELLAEGLEGYRQDLVRVETLREAGAAGGADYDVSKAMFHIALVEATIALEQHDADDFAQKLTQCLKLAKQHDDETRQSIVSKNDVRPLTNRIRIAWLERISAPAGRRSRLCSRPGSTGSFTRRADCATASSRQQTPTRSAR